MSWTLWLVNRQKLWARGSQVDILTSSHMTVIIPYELKKASGLRYSQKNTSQRAIWSAAVTLFMVWDSIFNVDWCFIDKSRILFFLFIYIWTQVFYWEIYFSHFSYEIHVRFSFTSLTRQCVHHLKINFT